MRLEHGDNPFFRPTLPGCSDRGVKFGWMMTIVFNHHDLTIGYYKLANLRKTSSNAFERAQAIYNGRQIETQFPGNCNGAQRIADVMHTRQVEAHFKRISLVGKVRPEMHHPAILHQVGSANISLLGKTVSDDGAGHRRDHFRDMFVIQAEHCRPVKRQVVQKIQERLLEIVKAVFVGFQVIPVDIRDQGNHGLQQQERSVAFIRLGNQVLTLSKTGIAAPGVQQTANDESGVHSGFGQQAGSEAGRGRLAMRAGNRDTAPEAHQFSQHFCPGYNGYAQFAGGCHFRVFFRNRA